MVLLVVQIKGRVCIIAGVQLREGLLCFYAPLHIPIQDKKCIVQACYMKEV